MVIDNHEKGQTSSCQPQTKKLAFQSELGGSWINNKDQKKRAGSSKFEVSPGGQLQAMQKAGSVKSHKNPLILL